MRQQAPSTAIADDVEDRIKDLVQVMHPRPYGGFGSR
jgi:hypothetical protein